MVGADGWEHGEVAPSGHGVAVIPRGIQWVWLTARDLNTHVPKVLWERFQGAWQTNMGERVQKTLYTQETIQHF